MAWKREIGTSDTSTPKRADMTTKLTDDKLSRIRAVVRGCAEKGSWWYDCLLLLDEHAEYRERTERAEDFIRTEGYRRCDIPACNCPSWHGGHWRARLMEADKRLEKLDALEAAGVDNWEGYDDALSSLSGEEDGY